MSAKDDAWGEVVPKRKEEVTQQLHYMQYKEPYSVAEFAGSYHAHAIAHPFPVPGSAIVADNDRKAFIADRQVKIQSEVDGIAKAHAKSAKLKARTARLLNNIVFQVKVNDSIGRLESILQNSSDFLDGKGKKAVTPPKIKHQQSTTKGPVSPTAPSPASESFPPAPHSPLPHTASSGDSVDSAPRRPAAPPSQQYVPSFWALVGTGRSDLVANFLSSGFPHIDGPEPKMGNTVLMAAVKKGDKDMVETLLKFGADCNKQNDVGDSAIHYCWRFWDRPADKTSVKLTDDARLNGELAAEKWASLQEGERRLKEHGDRTVRMLQLLLAHGAEPDKRAGDGSSALHDAARKGPIQAVALLLHFKADPFVRNDGNQTPMDVAKQMRKKEAESLLKRWSGLKKPLLVAEYLSEWKYFLDDVDIPIVVPSLSAKRVIDDLTIIEHQQTLERWKRVGMPVVDEIVSGPLDIPLPAKTSVNEEKMKLMETKKGRALKTHHKNEDHARVQKFVGMQTLASQDMSLSEIERKLARVKEIQKERAEGKVSIMRMPKKDQTLEVPLDMYLSGKIDGGFKESKAKEISLTREELIGVGAKQRVRDEEKRRLIRLHRLQRVENEDEHRYTCFGVGRPSTLPPSDSDNRHRAAALQIGNDGANFKTLSRPSHNSVIGVPYRKEKSAEELDEASRRRPDVDKRIQLRPRLTAMEAKKIESALPDDGDAGGDPALMLIKEAKRRRNPAISGSKRAQLCEDGLLPALPPNPDLKLARAFLEEGYQVDELEDLLSLPSAQLEEVLRELEEQSLEQKSDISAEKLKRGQVVYHKSTHVSKTKELNARMSRIFKVRPGEPWNNDI